LGIGRQPVGPDGDPELAHRHCTLLREPLAKHHHPDHQQDAYGGGGDTCSQQRPGSRLHGRQIDRLRGAAGSSSATQHGADTEVRDLPAAAALLDSDRFATDHRRQLPIPHAQASIRGILADL